MKKTLLALLLILCMLVTLTAFTASAEETETVEETASGHTHCVCGGSAVGVYDHECADIIWTPLSEALAEVGLTMQTADFGKLPTGNYYLDGDVTVANDTYFDAKQQISICLNGHSVSTKAKGTDGKTQGTFGYVRAGAQLTICDCSGKQDANGNWTWDGTITGGTRAYGGVFEICANTRAYVYGGNFVGDTGTTGVVFNVCKDYYTMAGGTSNSSAGLYSELYIYNGHITGGKATKNGGAINVWHSSNLYIYGGTVTGGDADRGGNINLGDGTYVFSNCVISGGVTNTIGRDVYCAATSKLTVSGNVTIGDVYVANGNGNFTIDEMKDSVGISNAHKDHCVCAGEAKGLGDHVCNDQIQWTPWGYLKAERSKLPSTSGNYYLVSNLSYTSGKELPSGTTINICLNGRTITQSTSGRTNVKGTASYTTCTGTGKIKTTSKGTYAGIFYCYNDSKLTIYAGTYDASGAKVADGGVAHIGNSAAAYMDIYGGEFLGATLTMDNAGSNCYSARGGILNITVNSIVNMYGGTFSGGVAQEAKTGYTPMGGCVLIYSGEFNVYGGTISGGKNHSVYLRNDASAKMTVGGDAQIDDVYVSGKRTFTTNEDFTGSIGVTAATKRQKFTTVTGAEQMKCFTAVEAGYRVKSNASNDLMVDWIELDHVYVDATNGNDANSGAEATPVKTTSRAMTQVNNNGTIHVVGTVQVNSWSKHAKTFTITGDELVMPSVRANLWDNVTFDGLTITMPMETDTTSENLGSYFFYCNGFTTVFQENVTVRYLYNDQYLTDPYQTVTYTKTDGTTKTVDASSNMYGGGPSASGTITGTNLTVLSGIWGRIFGGCNGVDMVGDVHLTVGGNVNQGVDYETVGHGDDASHYQILGGSRSGDIDGTVYMHVTGGTHVSTHGGSSGTSSITAIEMTVSGGEGMAIYGAGRSGVQTIGTLNVYYEGGTFEQVFGGALSNMVVGDVNMYVTGGNITRRLYGGCYSEYELLKGWTADNYVTGDVNLLIGEGANISCDSSYSDRGIYGHSRRGTCSTTDVENANVIFLTKAAYENNSSKLGAIDSTTSLIMGKSPVADLICYLDWSADDEADVIYANATAVKDPKSGHTGDASAICATVALTVDDICYYEDKTCEPATVTVSDNWYYGEPVLTYANNTSVGTATATVTANGLTVSKNFEIVDGKLTAIVNKKTETFYSLQAAVDAAGKDGLVQLTAKCDQNITVSSDLYLDLAGYDLTGTVTVAEGATLYGMDSTTDDYVSTEESYGTIAKVEGAVAHNFKTDKTGSIRRYVTHTTADGVVSFHRFYVGLTSMTLRPGVTGVGYKATFAGDHVVKSMVEEYGYNLWVEGYEEHAFTGALTADKFTAAKNVVTLLLKNFDVENFSQTPVHATAYIKLNGQTVSSASYYYTLKDLVEHIAKDVSGYTVDQMEPLQKMCKAYETVMEGWTNIANILNWKAPAA